MGSVMSNTEKDHGSAFEGHSHKSTAARTVDPVETARPASRAEEIATALEGEIVRGELPPGQRLDEQVLGNRFNVSRTPVREALRLLAASSLITLEPRLGAIVARPTVSEIIDLFELVGELEAVAARLACERMTAFHRARITEAHIACRRASTERDVENYIARNDAFHAAIHAAAENGALISQIAVLNKRLSPYRRFITFRSERKQTAEHEHEVLANALAAGDGAAAADAMREHVQMLADDALILARSLRL